MSLVGKTAREGKTVWHRKFGQQCKNLWS